MFVTAVVLLLHTEATLLPFVFAFSCFGYFLYFCSVVSLAVLKTIYKQINYLSSHPPPPECFSVTHLSSDVCARGIKPVWNKCFSIFCPCNAAGQVDEPMSLVRLMMNEDRYGAGRGGAACPPPTAEFAGFWWMLGWLPLGYAKRREAGKSGAASWTCQRHQDYSVPFTGPISSEVHHQTLCLNIWRREIRHWGMLASPLLFLWCADQFLLRTSVILSQFGLKKQVQCVKKGFSPVLFIGIECQHLLNKLHPVVFEARKVIYVAVSKQ